MTEQHPVVVLTGASSGIGRSTALHFAAKRARLVLVSRGALALDQLVEECVRAGAVAVAVPADVSDESAVQAVARTAVDRFGRIDVWVNDASVASFGSVLDADMADFRRILDVNVMGTVYGARAALEVMRPQGQGVIVNVASILGEVPEPYFAAYNMSKAAVMAFGVTLRSELAVTGMSKIHVSTVLPATTDTPFFEHAGNTSGRRPLAMPPVYAPEKVARAIVGAATNHRPEIVIGVLGRTFVRLHRTFPRLIEAQIAVQAEHLQLSTTEPADDTKGNLYAVPAGGRVTGGWRGAERTRRRTLIGLTLLGTGAGVLVSRLLRTAR